MAGRSFIPLFGRLYLTLHKDEDALRLARLEASNFLIIPQLCMREPGSVIDEEGFQPPSLSEIFKFDQCVRTIERKNPIRKLVFIAGRTMHNQSRVIFLTGCHAIISCDAGFDEVKDSIANLNVAFNQLFSSVSFGLSVQSCLSAFFCAKNSNWIDFRETFSKMPTLANGAPILMEEYMHYAR